MPDMMDRPGKFPGKSVNRRKGFTPGSVIGNDYFVRGSRLMTQAIQNFCQCFWVIISRYDNRDIHVLPLYRVDQPVLLGYFPYFAKQPLETQ
jgi:hypothetical protein